MGGSARAEPQSGCQGLNPELPALLKRGVYLLNVIVLYARYKLITIVVMVGHS